MSSKWCKKCGKVVTTNTIPKYCAWCGNSLVREPVLPEYKTWEEQSRMITRLRANMFPRPVPVQMKLF